MGDPDMIRPGPASLEPGRAPQGLVLHLYSVPGAELLLEQTLTIDDDLENLGTEAATLAADLKGDVCIVIYDGEDGHRWSVAEILGFPHVRAL
jgi:hypothetical protein